MLTNPERIKRGLWWDRAFYVTHGCRPRSEGCAHCWAAQASHMRAHNPHPAVAERHVGITDEHRRFNGHVNLDPTALTKPFKVHQRMVWAVWDDLFYGDDADRQWCEQRGVDFEPVPFSFAARALETMYGASWHTFIILTKRPGRMAEFFSKYAIDHEGEPLVSYAPEARYLCEPDQWPLSNVVLGTTVEKQSRVGRLEALFQSPAHRYVVSCEPLLEYVDLQPYLDKLDGVIVGGETGAKARPMPYEAVLWMKDDCLAADTDFFFKHWGEYAPVLHDGFRYTMERVGRRAAGRFLDGKTWDCLPW